MTDAFASLVDPIFHHVVDLRESFRQGEHPSPESVKRGLTKAIQTAQGKVEETQAADFALVRFALIYWADEVLIESAWRYADAWKNSIMELDYFGTRRAAVDFWIRAKQAEARAQGRNQSPRSIDVLEVFFLCVALGFRGELFLDETEIEVWTARVGPIIRARAAEPSVPSLPLRMREGLIDLRGDRMLFMVSMLVSATSVLTVLGFIIAVHLRGI